MQDEKFPPIQQVIDLGLLPRLVDKLKEGSRNRTNTMKIIANIVAKGTEGHRQSVIGVGAIPAIVAFLSSVTKRKLVMAATVSLGYMAYKSTTVRDHILEAGALSLLIKSSSRWCDQEFLGRNEDSVHELCGGFPFPSSLATDTNDCLEPLRKHLFTSNDEVLSYTCEVLLSLSKPYIEAGSFGNAIVEAGLFPRLFELIIHPNIEVQDPALSVVVNLTSRVKSCIQMVISNNSFPSLISCTLSPDEDVRTSAGKIIIHLLDGAKDQVQSFLDRGCVRALSCLLSSTNPIVLNKLALDGLKKVVSLPEDTEICDSEVELVECKLSDLERGTKECSGDEYAEMRNMIASIRKEIKDMAPGDCQEEVANTSNVS